MDATIHVSLVAEIVVIEEKHGQDDHYSTQADTVGDGKFSTDTKRLYLFVRGGSRAWKFRYTKDGKAKQMSLGTMPGTSFKEAKERAGELSILLSQGGNPAATTTDKPRKPIFTTCAARYILPHRRGWSNAKHARQWVSTLKTYARPIIGDSPVDEIGTEDVLRVLSPIWTIKTETAKRVQGRVENILDYAAAMKWRDPLNPARWRGHLDKLLPSPRKAKKATHHPAMPYTEVPAFMRELVENGFLSAKALALLIFTVTRTSEILGATWNEFNLEAATWTIPATRMKAKREHRVPLSEAALAILASLPRVGDYVFPGQRYGRSLSNMALLQLMRGMGYGVNGTRGDYVPHGFRSSFRDWAGEVSSFPNHVCEMALAHVIGNAAEAAYRRGDLFDKRRKMMQAWADYLVAVVAGTKIVPIHKSA